MDPVATLIQYLAADSAVAALVGDRVGTRWQPTQTLPAISVTLADRVPRKLVEQGDPAQIVRVQIDVLAGTVGELPDWDTLTVVTNAVVDALEDAFAEVNGVVISEGSVTSITETEDPDTGNARSILFAAFACWQV